jgi:hypothetical protein
MRCDHDRVTHTRVVDRAGTDEIGGDDDVTVGANQQQRESTVDVEQRALDSARRRKVNVAQRTR